MSTCPVGIAVCIGQPVSPGVNRPVSEDFTCQAAAPYVRGYGGVLFFYSVSRCLKKVARDGAEGVYWIKS